MEKTGEMSEEVENELGSKMGGEAWNWCGGFENE